MKAPALTLYYDGQCAFCTAEMARLARWDQPRAAALAFVDIAQPGFNPAHLNASMAQLNAQLYSSTRNGRVLVGIDSMLAAYTLVGRGYLVWPLRVPVLRNGLALLYRAFAHHRYAMSRLLGYRPQPACSAGVCKAGNPFLIDGSEP